MTRRSPHEGSVYQRKNGRWVGALDLGWSTGKRQRRYVYGKTRREAQLKLADLRRRHGLGLRVDKDAQTVENFLTRWLDWKESHVRPRTIATYRMYLERHVIPDLGGYRLVTLTVEAVQTTLDTCRGTMTPRSVRAVRDILRGALADAMRWGEVERNVAALARPPAASPQSLQPLTKEQASTLLVSMKGHRLEPLFRVTILLGLRRGEALGLHWADVDLKRKTLHVRRSLQRAPGVGLVEEEPKSERSRRTIALPTLAVSALRVQQKAQKAARVKAADWWVDSGYVFTTDFGKPLDPNYVSREFRSLADSAGLPDLSFHGLRHAAATFMLAAGVPLRVVQETLGHSTIAVTADIYGHVLPELQRAAAKAMDATLEAADATAKGQPRRGRPRPAKAQGTG